jgi:hypothetical protein
VKTKKISLAAELESLYERAFVHQDPNPKYELPVTVWMGPANLWGGERVDVWTFSSKEDALRTKDILETMIGEQKRSLYSVVVGHNESEWLKPRGGELFMILWSVGKIVNVLSKTLKKKKANKMKRSPRKGGSNP